MSTPSRVDLLRTRMFAEALLAATKEALGNEAALEWDQGTAVSWRTPYGTLSASITNDTLAIENEQVFLRWLRESHPTEVVEVLAPVNPNWVNVQKAKIAELVKAGKQDAPPGTKLVEGGAFSHLSHNQVPTGLKGRLKTQATLLLATGVVRPDEVWARALTAPAGEVVDGTVNPD